MQENITSPWSVTSQEVFKTLGTSEGGLTSQEAEKRSSQYKNLFKSHDRFKALSIFAEQVISPLMILLVVAAGITMFLGEWANTAVIVLAIVVNVGLGFYREFQAETTIERLTTYIKQRVRVTRDGYEQEIDATSITLGDVIILTPGSRVPADARIISCNDARVDESVLTGESVPVEKNIEVLSAGTLVSDRKNMVFAGTLVSQGLVTAVVTAVGDATEIGIIAKMVAKTRRAKTPLQKSFINLAWLIFVITIVIVAGLFILGVLRGESVGGMLILAVAVAVGAVPESLPIALTVILAAGAERIAKNRGVARTLAAAETLGSATLIMTDKTGTLTMADMRLDRVIGVHELISGSATSDHDKKELLEKAVAGIDVLIENPRDEAAQWKFQGRPFEVAIAKSAQSLQIDMQSILSVHERTTIPFNSTNKFSAAYQEGKTLVMGAPDILLNHSDFPDERKAIVRAWIEQASIDGLRLIGVGDIPEKIQHSNHVKDISFAGIIAFRDPIRPQVPDALRHLEKLGTRVVMITGDLPGTARAIARELGWEVTDNKVLSGEEIRSMTDEELLGVIPRIKIFARVTPADKLRVGTLFQKLGEVVAMTGDGVNDAPALKAMNIGVAVGSGTDVAKSAADLVLLDDNFHTVAQAVLEGRRMLTNIRKAFVYLVSNCLDEVLLVGGSMIAGIPIPLTALQIIWVNLFTGSLPAIAYAFDPDLDGEHTGAKTLRSMFTPQVKILTIGIGFVISALLWLLYAGLLQLGVAGDIARSVLFACFASYILVIAFSFRSLHKPIFTYPIFANKALNRSILIAAVLLVGTYAFPFARKFFDLAMLPIWSMVLIGAWLVVTLVVVEGAKYLFNKQKTIA